MYSSDWLLSVTYYKARYLKNRTNVSKAVFFDVSDHDDGNITKTRGTPWRSRLVTSHIKKKKINQS